MLHTVSYKSGLHPFDEVLKNQFPKQFRFGTWHLKSEIGSRYTIYMDMALVILSVFELIFGSASPLVIILSTGLFGFAVSTSVGTLSHALTTSIFGSREYI
ncbi:hypothetical protein [Sporosarcina sp. A2]|uniref:hypothetical protein n=1 Tax=Sporosarcina sp. A2 TaxID=3393449 RepID=UPI003D791F6E